MCEYQQVLRHVQIIMQKINGGGQGLTASMHGGLQPAEPYRHSLNDEDEKMVNTPLIGGEVSVAITQIAGTINTEEK